MVYGDIYSNAFCVKCQDPIYPAGAWVSYAGPICKCQQQVVDEPKTAQAETARIETKKIKQIHDGDPRLSQLYAKLERAIEESEDMKITLCAAIGVLELLKNNLILEALGRE